MAEKVILTEYSDEMQESFINYSMSVITSRAVPDIRDGLKPVQRRVLYAMGELGLNADKPHKKSARIVGDAMGKYHPHGDSSIYEALVVLSQDFKKGMALIDGHGNFGSIEGDGAAAMRYTEARLKKFTEEVYLKDLDKNVVDFVPNYDETDKEPEVLPVRIPNFLVNGSEGIAVGMVTSTPSHNLSEVVDAMELLIKNPNCTTKDLLKVMPGPDFPTGGIVTNQSDLLEIYETGKGKIKIRGKASYIKSHKRGEKDRIEITEIPYTMIGAAIGKFLSDIADLVEKKVLPDITDISNQSGKEGIKLVLELKSGADGDRILNMLYKKTKLEDTFGVNMLCIADGRPEVFGLKRILEENLRFQLSVNRRKYTTLLEKEEKKKEIEEGLIKAVDILDLIIEVIRGSKKLEDAKACLTLGNTEKVHFKNPGSEKEAKKLHFSDVQAQAILDMPLRKLIGLEILELKNAYKESVEKITRYQLLLSDPKEMKKKILNDLHHIKDEYGVPRRTELTDAEEVVIEEVPEEIVPVLFTMNRFGYVRSFDLSFYEKNREAIEEDSVHMIFCMSNSKICLFTDTGFCHQIKLKDVPNCHLRDKGIPVDNISAYDSAKETILKVEDYDTVREKVLLFVTSRGMIKHVEGNEFESVKRSIAATKLLPDDKLVYVDFVQGNETALVTKSKTVLKFLSEEISLYKKTSVGVRGLKLDPDDSIQAVYTLNSSAKCLIKIGTKTVDLAKVPLKKRDGKPVAVK